MQFHEDLAKYEVQMRFHECIYEGKGCEVGFSPQKKKSENLGEEFPLAAVLVHHRHHITKSLANM